MSRRRFSEQILGLSKLLIIIPLVLLSGCGAFLEDYNYSPVGTDISSNTY